MFTRILFFLLSSIILCIPEALAGGLDNVANGFQAASAGWMANAQGYAKSLFLGLAGLEFCWSAIQYTLKKGDLPDFLASVTLKVMGIGFFYSLLVMAPSWIPAVMNSFSQAGTTIGGSVGIPMTPSAIIDQGIAVAAQLVSSLNQSNASALSVGSVISSGGASLGNFMLSAIVIGLSGLFTIAAFTLVAIQLLVTLIESYIVIGGGMLMLGFLGSRWTLPFGEKYFGYAVSVGIKLFVLYLVVGAGGSLSNDIIHHIQSLGHPPGFTDYFAAGAAAMGYGALGFMAPGLAGSMMNGSPALSMGNMSAAAGGISGSGVAATAMGGAALIGGTQAAQGIYDKTMGALKAGEKAVGGIAGASMGSMVGGVSGTSAGGGSGHGFAGAVSGMPGTLSAPPGMSGGASTSPARGLIDTRTSVSQAVSEKDQSVPPGSATTSRTQPNEGSSGGEVSKKPVSIRLGEHPDVSTSSTVPDTANSAPASSISSMASAGSGADVKPKGGTDAIADPKDPKKKGSVLGTTADHLHEMARSMDRLPQQDGHSGGISIRLNHTE